MGSPISSRSFIQRISPSCYSTLSHISWNVHFTINSARQTLLDPYGNLCDSPFSELAALQDLAVSIDLVGYLDLHPASFGQ